MEEFIQRVQEKEKEIVKLLCEGVDSWDTYKYNCGRLRSIREIKQIWKEVTTHASDD